MSWSMWHENGIGFETDAISKNAFVAFMINHRGVVETWDWKQCAAGLPRHKTGNDLLEDLAKFGDVPEWTEDELDIIEEYFPDAGIAEPIGMIMHKETGIRFCAYPPDDDGRTAVMFAPEWPWTATASERLLTSEDDLRRIIKRYTKELEMPEDTNLEVDLTYSG